MANDIMQVEHRDVCMNLARQTKFSPQSFYLAYPSMQKYSCHRMPAGLSGVGCSPVKGPNDQFFQQLKSSSFRRHDESLPVDCRDIHSTCNREEDWGRDRGSCG